MKKIVICCDGTWNKPDQKSNKFNVRKPTNITKISRALKTVGADNKPQICYYDTGVGTGNMWDKFIGGGTGKGLELNIIEAYRFLVNNYHEGDEVFLFGFSRGAYTVRSLSGLISLIGLLPKNNDYWFPEGMELYREKLSADDQAVLSYRKKNKTKTMPIKFIGVFDTVGALGIPIGYFKELSRRKHAFHDVKVSPNVEHAYHALAIDEHRKAFKPAIWNAKKAHQTLEQVWFPGVHTNIGGGYDDDGLANCALQWMLSKATAHGLTFDDDYLGFYEPFPGDTLYESKKGLYKFAGDYPRPICSMKKSNESLHNAVFKRWNSTSTSPQYRPKNLKKYFESASIDPSSATGE